MDGVIVDCSLDKNRHSLLHPPFSITTNFKTVHLEHANIPL